jgi:iron uptake system component EfeO
LSAKSGPITFVVVNGGTTKLSELEVRKANGVILGERENVVGKNDSGTFALKLGPGHYILTCPLPLGGGNGTLVVTGKPVSVSATPGTKLAAAANGYQAYVKRQVGILLQGTERFTTALTAGNLAQAKSLYGPVRRHYEAIEPVAESFSGLDSAIDARVDDVAPGTPWTGFHHIEQILWQQNTTAGTAALAKKLNDDVATLQRKVATLSYQPAQLANGSVELLNEVATSKITGEEDRYSHTDLSDFQGNLDGARVAFDLLRPALDAEGERVLGNTVAQRFAVVQTGLNHYRRRRPPGFAYYSALTPADRLVFAREVDALAEPLSTVAAKVSGTG